MRLILRTQIDGLFEGYEPGRVHRLSNGQSWRQVCLTSQYVFREDPDARLLHDGARYYLEVEGTDGVVQVELVHSIRTTWPRAY
jgi:hypothetical protein